MSDAERVPASTPTPERGIEAHPTSHVADRIAARKLLYRVALELDALRVGGHLPDDVADTARLAASQAATWSERAGLDAAHPATVQVGVRSLLAAVDDEWASQRLAGCDRRLDCAVDALGGEA